MWKTNIDTFKTIRIIWIAKVEHFLQSPPAVLTYTLLRSLWHLLHKIPVWPSKHSELIPPLNYKHKILQASTFLWTQEDLCALIVLSPVAFFNKCDISTKTFCMWKTLLALSILIVERIVFFFAGQTFFFRANFSINTVRKLNIKSQLKQKRLLNYWNVVSDWIIAQYSNFCCTISSPDDFGNLELVKSLCGHLSFCLAKNIYVRWMLNWAYSHRAILNINLSIIFLESNSECEGCLETPRYYRNKPIIKGYNLLSILDYSDKSCFLRKAAVVASKRCMIVNKSIL